MDLRHVTTIAITCFALTCLTVGVGYASEPSATTATPSVSPPVHEPLKTTVEGFLASRCRAQMAGDGKAYLATFAPGYTSTGIGPQLNHSYDELVADMEKPGQKWGGLTSCDNNVYAAVPTSTGIFAKYIVTMHFTGRHAFDLISNEGSLFVNDGGTWRMTRTEKYGFGMTDHGRTLPGAGDLAPNTTSGPPA